jgi:hypothetical protein
MLTVFDAQNQKLWEYVSPQNLSYGKLSSSDPKSNDPLLRRHKIVDLNNDKHPELLFGASETLFCFRNNGKLAWTHRVGREVTTKQGRAIPTDFFVLFVEALSKPRSDGGRVIVGAYRGPGALFVVEMLTGEGRKVGEYFHYGWLWAAKTMVLGQDGHEDIFLGGVDSALGVPGGYTATLVALDPNRLAVEQASTMIGEERSLGALPTAREKAVVVFRDYAPSSDSNEFCRVARLAFAGKFLQVTLDQGNGLKQSHFTFNQRLQLQSVTPDNALEVFLRQSILKDVPATRWQAAVRETLGDIRYLRNEY